MSSTIVRSKKGGVIPLPFGDGGKVYRYKKDVRSRRSRRMSSTIAGSKKGGVIPLPFGNGSKVYRYRKEIKSSMSSTMAGSKKGGVISKENKEEPPKKKC